MKKIINTEHAPAAIGPYSQGVIVGDLIYTSGQLPLNPETKVLETEIKAATKQSLENCKAILILMILLILFQRLEDMILEQSLVYFYVQLSISVL